MLSFHVKFVQTDRWTTVKQYAPDLWMRGIKTSILQKYEISNCISYSCTGVSCSKTINQQLRNPEEDGRIKNITCDTKKTQLFPNSVYN